MAGTVILNVLCLACLEVPQAGEPPAFTGSVAERYDDGTEQDGSPALPDPAREANSNGDTQEIVVQGRRKSKSDPLAPINAKTFAMSQRIDDVAVGPLAHTYTHKVPGPIRSGLRNFLNNTREPVVFVSFLLELKPGKAAETAVRFAVNTVAGIAGVLDVAKRRPFNLPRRPNGFGDVLGYHGVGPGAFLFLPLIGPTTVRDAIGGAFDRLILPSVVGAPFNQLGYALATGAISAIDRRASFDQELADLRRSSEPYRARRELFLAQRRAEIEALHSWRYRGRSAATVETPSAADPQPASSNTKTDLQPQG